MTKPLCSLNSFQMSKERSALCRLSAALIFNFQSPASVVNNTGPLFTEVTVQTELSRPAIQLQGRSLKSKVTVLGRECRGVPTSAVPSKRVRMTGPGWPEAAPLRTEHGLHRTTRLFLPRTRGFGSSAQGTGARRQAGQPSWLSVCDPRAEKAP